MTPKDRTVALFADWCAASGYQEDWPTNRDAISAFFEDVPVKPSTREIRERILQREYAARGFVFPTDSSAGPELLNVRSGDDWNDVDEALRRSPRRGAAGLYGRRDALLLVLREAGVGKGRIRALVPSETNLEAWTVAGRHLVKGSDPIVCRRCTLIRWLDVLGCLPPVGFRGDAQRVLEMSLPAEHVCERGPLRRDWRRAWSLVPAVDQHWWASERGLASRTVADITARRQSLDAPPVFDELGDGYGTATEWHGLREARVELADLLDQLDEGLNSLDVMAGDALRRDQVDEDAP